ncbi:MAG: enoyl-[acyl-carrier-protein] reductase FabK [Dehalococcoidia bacterium]|jgi:enoyl-[acyl-carrier protein] reductase II|nr:enoyl-[acyl-carrier-protein] reductase FabK [Dehalococcoidia bacterium]
MRTAICDLFGIEYPVIQGGMAWLGTAELASAVSNGGGLGIIGAGNAPPSWIREQIRATREWTSKPFAVNIMLMTPFLEEVIQVVLEEGVSIVTTGGGNPGVYIPTFKEAGIKVMPVVSSVALAKRLERAGADALVAEGLESGGHIGETATMALLPQVVDSVTIPVVAAGGIGDGRGLAAALCLGAQGVQLGTRFVCAEECVAHPNFKRKVLEARDRSTVATGYATGHPVRCIENRLTRQFQALERGGASVEELELLGQGKLELAALNGDTEEGSVMAGQIAGLITDIKPAAAIIKEIVDQAESIIARLSNSYVGVRHG